MLRTLSTLVLLALLPVSAGTARAARSIVDRGYDCKIIASTREFPAGPDWLGPPTMNAAGQVIFLAFTPGGAELRVGRGDLVAGVPSSDVVAEASQDPLAAFWSIEEGVIDDAGRVTFLAYANGSAGEQGIYRVANQAPPSPLYVNQAIDAGSDYLGFDPLDTLGANATGSVVFQGITATNGTAYFRDGTELARDYDNGIQGVNPPVLLHPGQPWTAFQASLDAPNYGEGIFVNGAKWVSSTPSGEGGFTGLSLSGNAAPLIAYTRSGFPGIDSWELAVTGPLGTDVYVDADVDPFEPFGATGATSTNSRGEVAFIASPAGDGDTLLVADGSQQIRRVHCKDQDAIFGASFYDLGLSPHALNSNGSIAFLGRTFEHRFLVRAPEASPNELTIAASLGLCMVKRARSWGARIHLCREPASSASPA